jgi:uncharacterized membrane protein
MSRINPVAPKYPDPIAAANTGPAMVASPAQLPKTVSGGRGSLLPYDKLTDEGKRFVSESVSAKEIARVMGEPAEQPIRIYAGLYEANSPGELAKQTLAEMVRKGAFDKDAVLLFCTIGTGAAAPATTEAAEYLTRGHVATVALQYSTLSSVAAVLAQEEPRAAEMFKDLLVLVNQERKRRAGAHQHVPKLFVTGESLGAWGSEQAFVHPGPDTAIDGAMWTGTPYA